MIIAFCGTSGSGKTTIINRLKDWKYLADKNVIIRSEDNFLSVRFARKIFGNDIFTKYQEEKFFRKGSGGLLYYLFATCGNILYPLFVYIEFWFEYFHYQILSGNTIVLKDRYIQDYSVTINEVLKISSPITNFFYSHFPNPSLTFYLKIDKETALKRNKNDVKGKITSETAFIERVMGAYNSLCQKDNIFTLDTTKNISDSLKEIEEAVMTKKKLYSTRRVAIIGMDGSGKTTLANSLCKYFKSLNEKSIVIHFYHENLLYKFLRILGFFNRSNLTQEKIYEISRKHAIKNKESGTPFSLAFLRFTDSLIQYLFAVLTHRKSIIIFDRFFYDYLVSFEYLNVPNRKFFNRLIPKVDYCIYLATTPQVSLTRKPENTSAFFKEDHKLYFDISKKYGIKTIDSTKADHTAVLNEAIEQLTE